MVRHGNDLCRIVLDALEAEEIWLRDNDVVVIAQKIVSRAEGRSVVLADITPSAQAMDLAQRSGKDPRLAELILSESEEVVRARPGVVIVRHRLGLVLANAGIDHSNVPGLPGESVLLLPQDPDASAARLREGIAKQAKVNVGVLIIDSIGRAWRLGTVGTAIGAAGVTALADLRGAKDLNGRTLEASEVGVADELAAAASLVMGQADEGTPIVVVRGFKTSGVGTARDLIRPLQLDMFQ